MLFSPFVEVSVVTSQAIRLWLPLSQDLVRGLPVEERSLSLLSSNDKTALERRFGINCCLPMSTTIRQTRGGSEGEVAMKDQVKHVTALLFTSSTIPCTCTFVKPLTEILLLW